MKKIFSIFGGVDELDAFGLTALYRAARHGNTQKVAKLLKKGADPNKKTACGFYPLHIAAFWGEHKIVRMLVEAGADVNVTNDAGWTSLHSASLCAGLEGRRMVIDLLIAKGAKKDVKDAHGWTPHDYAKLWDEPDNERLKAIFAQLEKDKSETTGHQPDLDKLGLDKNGKNPPRRPRDGQIPRHH